jgi:hypothetical protein
MLTVQLQGGLGNQLFQLAFLDSMSKKTGRAKFITTTQSPVTVHSNQQYFETIFKNWKSLYSQTYTVLVREHPNFVNQEWNIPDVNVMFHGYFQKYQYTDPIIDEFKAKLCFNESILQKYPSISEKIVIHIRGGDYKGNCFHEQPLQNYYKKCMELCAGEQFVVFTNDIHYARGFLPNTEIIEESEEDSLFLMTKAKGVICANSSFSWWVAYLNPNRPIFMPSKWFSDPQMNTDGYYFKGCTIVEV